MPLASESLQGALKPRSEKGRQRWSQSPAGSHPIGVAKQNFHRAIGDDETRFRSQQLAPCGASSSSTAALGTTTLAPSSPAWGPFAVTPSRRRGSSSSSSALRPILSSPAIALAGLRGFLVRRFGSPKAAFERMDFHKDGHVSCVEFQEVVSGQERYCSFQEARDLFSLLARGTEGWLTWKVFHVALTSENPLQLEGSPRTATVGDVDMGSVENGNYSQELPRSRPPEPLQAGQNRAGSALRQLFFGAKEPISKAVETDDVATADTSRSPSPRQVANPPVSLSTTASPKSPAQGSGLLSGQSGRGTSEPLASASGQYPPPRRRWPSEPTTLTSTLSPTFTTAGPPDVLSQLDEGLRSLRAEVAALNAIRDSSEFAKGSLPGNNPREALPNRADSRLEFRPGEPVTPAARGLSSFASPFPYSYQLNSQSHPSSASSTFPAFQPGSAQPASFSSSLSPALSGTLAAAFAHPTPPPHTTAPTPNPAQTPNAAALLGGPHPSQLLDQHPAPLPHAHSHANSSSSSLFPLPPGSTTAATSSSSAPPWATITAPCSFQAIAAQPAEPVSGASAPNLQAAAQAQAQGGDVVGFREGGGGGGEGGGEEEAEASRRGGSSGSHGEPHFQQTPVQGEASDSDRRQGIGHARAPVSAQPERIDAGDLSASSVLLPWMDQLPHKVQGRLAACRTLTEAMHVLDEALGPAAVQSAQSSSAKPSEPLLASSAVFEPFGKGSEPLANISSSGNGPHQPSRHSQGQGRCNHGQPPQRVHAATQCTDSLHQSLPNSPSQGFSGAGGIARERQHPSSEGVDAEVVVAAAELLQSTRERVQNLERQLDERRRKHAEEVAELRQKQREERHRSLQKLVARLVPALVEGGESLPSIEASLSRATASLASRCKETSSAASSAYVTPFSTRQSGNAATRRQSKAESPARSSQKVSFSSEQTGSGVVEDDQDSHIKLEELHSRPSNRSETSAVGARSSSERNEEPGESVAESGDRPAAAARGRSSRGGSGQRFEGEGAGDAASSPAGSSKAVACALSY